MGQELEICLPWSVITSTKRGTTITTLEEINPDVIVSYAAGVVRFIAIIGNWSEKLALGLC